jgi:hypothetical protein
MNGKQASTLLPLLSNQRCEEVPWSLNPRSNKKHYIVENISDNNFNVTLYSMNGKQASTLLLLLSNQRGEEVPWR